MVVRDPLAGDIPQTGQWEAQVLPKSTFDPVRYSEQLLVDERRDTAMRQQQKKLDDQANKALLNDDIQTKWDTDTQNYFMPKVEDLRNRVMSEMKKTNGNIGWQKRLQFENEWKSLHEQATLNNTLWDQYKANVKELDTDSPDKPKYDSLVARKMLETWRNPYSDPNLKKDIQENYGGDINKWRAVNAGKFTLPISFSKDQYYSEQSKDEQPSPYNPVDEHGKIKEITLSNGERAYLQGKKLSDDQVISLANRTWTGQGYRDQKAREAALQDVQNNFIIGQNGAVSFRADLPEGDKNNLKKAIKYAGDLKGLSPEEIQKRLTKGVIAAEYSTKKAETAVPVQEGFAPISGDKKDKEIVTIATHYSNIANQVEQNPNLSPDQVAQQFNGKAVVSPQTGLYRIDLPVPPTVKPFVAVPASSILTMQGGKYRPNTGVLGQIAGTVMSNSVQWKKNGVTVTPNTPGAKAYGQLIYNPVQVDTDNNDQLSQSYALFMSANPNTSVSKEVYKKMLEDGKKIGNTFKVEYDLTDPVQRTYYDNVLGGTAISQTAFNKEAKASKGSVKVKPTPQNTNKDPLGLFN